jgi:hypothetical protein
LVIFPALISDSFFPAHARLQPFELIFTPLFGGMGILAAYIDRNPRT